MVLRYMVQWVANFFYKIKNNYYEQATTRK